MLAALAAITPADGQSASGRREIDKTFSPTTGVQVSLTYRRIGRGPSVLVRLAGNRLAVYDDARGRVRLSRSGRPVSLVRVSRRLGSVTRLRLSFDASSGSVRAWAGRSSTSSPLSLLPEYRVRVGSNRRVPYRLGKVRVRTSSPMASRKPAPSSLDTTQPDTTITAGPSGSTESTKASFSFTSSEPGSSFQCRLDSASWASCKNPRNYGGLAPGSHMFSVRAKDASGNVDASPAARSWTIIPPPSAAFTYSPGSPVIGEDVTFDAGGSKCAATPCQYRWVDVGPDGPGGTDWPLGTGQLMSFSFPDAGMKYVVLTVTDASGGSASVEHDVSVGQPLDIIPPDTSITSSPSASTTSTSASFSFASTEAGSSFDCQLDAGSLTSCTSPSTYTGLAVGTHTFSVRAKDAAGNVDPSPASYTWAVQASAPAPDTTPPETTITAGPSGSTTATDASFSFSSSESGSSFECRLDNGSWASCTSPKAYSGLSNGSHTFDVRATDAAGNTDPSPASRTWTVDTVPGALYVDRDSVGGPCSDSRSSTQVTISTPWCSLQRAVAAAPSGSTVLVRAGSYSGRLQISGQSRTAKVTLRAYPGENASLPNGFYIYNSSNFRLQGFQVPVSTTADRSEVDISSNIDLVGNEFTTQGVVLKAPHDTLIEDNYFHDLRRLTPNPQAWGDGGDGSGIATNGYWNGGAQDNTINLTIRNNRFLRLPMDAIGIGGGEKRVYNVLIEGNEIGWVRRVNTVDHTDGIQLVGGTGITIRKNFIHDGDDAMFIADDWHRNLVVENNLMVSGGGALVQMYMTPDARVVNNTFWNSGYKALVFGVQAGWSPSGVVLQNNIIDKFAMTTDGVNFNADHPEWFANADYNLIPSGPLYGSHSVRTRPKFANPAVIPDGYVQDPAAGDYKLTSGSAGVDAGTSSGAPTTDLNGTARYDDPLTPNSGGGTFPYFDMGAFELSPGG